MWFRSGFQVFFSYTFWVQKEFEHVYRHVYTCVCVCVFTSVVLHTRVMCDSLWAKAEAEDVSWVWTVPHQKRAIWLSSQLHFGILPVHWPPIPATLQTQTHNDHTTVKNTHKTHNHRKPQSYFIVKKVYKWTCRMILQSSEWKFSSVFVSHPLQLSQAGSEAAGIGSSQWTHDWGRGHSSRGRSLHWWWDRMWKCPEESIWDTK